ncbi:MAG: O-acetyl-ADP-ribose deacetylase [Rectinemataceae bacterium]|nr:O-acetyl-ADP-ribose deacetylase [Rectinemataceae bacterium]
MQIVSRLLDGRLEILIGDITGFEGDGIVNAANSSLMGGGGVDGAIHSAGGPDILAECVALRRGIWKDGLPAGLAVSTTAGRLHARRVIHTVGPVWMGGGKGESILLESCYRKCLLTAGDEGLESIAFPAISTGVYRYPKTEAARIAYGAVGAWFRDHTVPSRVSFVFFKKLDCETFLTAIGGE